MGYLKTYSILFLLTLFCLDSFTQNKPILFSKEEKEWIKNNPVINFGYEPNWPPYEIYENGEYKGIVGDLINELSRVTKIKFVPIPNISWNESLAKLKSGEINMVACMGVTPERDSLYYITDPYFTDPLVIATRKDFSTINGMASLNSYKIALPEDYYTLDLISKDYPHLNIVTYKTIKECISSVSLGETDAFIESLGVVSYFINNHGFTNIKVSSSTPYLDSRFGLAVTKEWKIFHGIAQKVFDNMTVKQMSDIRSKWISVQYEHTTNNSKLIKLGLIIFIPSLIIMLFFFYWNRKLKNEIEKRIKIEKQLEESLEKINIQNNEKSVMLKEIHHRVKNNLQIVTSILRLQASNSDDEKAKESLSEASERVRSISLIHSMIYENENLAKIDFKNYIEQLVNEISSSFGGGVETEINIKKENYFLETKTLVPIALIFNELITNSLKYAFKDKNNGKISIHVSDSDKSLIIDYKDNGTWVPASENNTGFGISLIEILTQQLDGSYSLNKENGTSYSFILNIV